MQLAFSKQLALITGIGGRCSYSPTEVALRPTVEAILLIAAKRQDQISSTLAQHDYEINIKAEMLLEDNTELTRTIKILTEAIHGHLVTTTT